MRLIYLAFFLMTSGLAFSQGNSVISKVTATWCPNCGSWGWDYMETMKSDFADEPVLLLGVHDSGNLENPTSVWWSANMNAIGQPVFFLNSNPINASRNTWPSTIEGLQEDITTNAANPAMDINIETASFDNGNLEVSTSIKNIPAGSQNLFLAKYVYENNVENIQSGLSGTVNHPNVLRTSFSSEPYGIPLTDPADASYVQGSTIDPSWAKEQLGVLVVVWELVNNKYEIVASKAISSIALLLDTEEILDKDIFTFATGEDQVSISANNSDDYHMILIDMNGQKIHEESFSNATTVDTKSLATGIYVVNLRSGNKALNRQVFIK